ncbi:uncharacterized protein SAPINGB_P004050 [Magnusiomyces paraingens]|uniref:Prefoldin subunit 5 n=1 Tax=Magnusiomyces paraingens TaxID=2606893 RepID=A0A5E8BXZ1_9ASCO|nr:uncharacterized protein SAPINGB_P004050 [Saprochaete ingens]VVT54387.1 unnamed protein product [Saprochaete ingens]
MSAAPSTQIDVKDLSLAQLKEVQLQLQNEINHLQDSLEQLLMVQSRFRECAGSVDQLTGGAHPAQGGQSILVPLTSSLYVPGKIPADQTPENSTFMVDVGTGYYVEKNGVEAKKFFIAKTEKLDENMRDLKRIIEDKVKNFNVIQTVMKEKIIEQQQQQQQAQAQAKKVPA